jgi:hypothetical protein
MLTVSHRGQTMGEQAKHAAKKKLTRTLSQEHGPGACLCATPETETHHHKPNESVARYLEGVAFGPATEAMHHKTVGPETEARNHITKQSSRAA